jgi:hypothetical protein
LWQEAKLNGGGEVVPRAWEKQWEGRNMFNLEKGF